MSVLFSSLFFHLFSTAYFIFPLPFFPENVLEMKDSENEEVVLSVSVPKSSRTVTQKES